MFLCKLYSIEEYETPIGRMVSDRHNETTAGQWRYKYEKVKNYYKEREFNTEYEAYEWGSEQMFYDPECRYEIVEQSPKSPSKSNGEGS